MQREPKRNIEPRQETSSASLRSEADFTERERGKLDYLSIGSQQTDDKRERSSAHSALHTHRPHATSTLPTAHCDSSNASTDSCCAPVLE